MQLFVFLVIIAAASQQAHAGCFSFFSKKFKNEYEAINKHLTDKVSSDNRKLNMEEAESWLASKEAAGKTSPIVVALREFVALKSIVTDPSMCSIEGLEVLQMVNLGTQEQALTKNPERRVDKIIRQYTLEHARFCYNLYSDSIKARKRSLDPDMVRYAENLAASNRLTSRPLSNIQSEECDELMPKHEPNIIKNLRVYQAIYRSANEDKDENLKYLGKVDDGYNSKVLHEIRVQLLFDKYILEPCKMIDRQIGQDYYSVMDFDLLAQVKAGVTVKCNDLLQDWMAMRICNHLVHDKRFRQLTFKNLIKLVERH